MLKEKKFGMISLGCDKNRVDSEKLLGQLHKNGYTVTNDLTKAQILVVNTCAFLQTARAEAVETVLECAEYKKGNLEKIAVTGCLPQKFIEELFPALTEADVFCGINDYDELIGALEHSYQTGERQNVVGKGKETFHTERVVTTEPHVAYLKIADGCYNHCTYCLIPKIRGKYRSYPMENLIKEAEELGEIAELVIVAQDTTRYGEDLYGENKFVELLQKLSALENIQTIRLLYCYPDAFSDKLIAEIKTNAKILKYADIPLQHSENRVLKLMNRRGSREEYLALIEKLKEEIPSIAIRSTFISGFPTETEEECKAMQEFLRQAKLFNCGFFAYSKEPDTAAARLKGQIHGNVKKRRVKELYQVQQRISFEKLQTFVGQTVEVLCDGIDYEKSCFVGRAYFSAPDIDGKIYFHANEAVQGERYQIKIKMVDVYDMYGDTEDYQL
ncbi:MAG: 30S ribosomal protein S12 methylthiotransferase RimO [Clostridia bacterium]|nr:30S ribosomal protein S12 methylthiotransferase RimO [Clostridia bacterium]